MQTENDYRMLINGELISAQSTFSIENPATGQTFAHAPDASREDLDRAVAAARTAFPAWAARNVDERRAALVALADRLMENSRSMTRLLTKEQGKPHADAEAEVKMAADWLRGIAGLDMPVVVNEDSGHRYSETRYVPLGVVAAIAPWNYPVKLACSKLAPALLAGNTLVLKPSPFTPLTALKLAEMAVDLFPPGVLNVLSGGDELGPWLTSHPDVNKISFTGSTGTGKRVMASASETLKRITLELGGNDPAIVMHDLDVEKTAEALFWAAFGNAGQICIATKRMYVHKDVYVPLRDALAAYAKGVKVGDGTEQGTRVGPVNNIQQYQRVRELIQDARDQGYQFIAGGEEPEESSGYFIPITIVDNPPADSRIVREEQFGPVLPLIEFDDYDDAVAQANASEYGLGASVWGADEDAAWAIAQRLEAGNIWVNESRHLSPKVAFSGHKQSGVGVENGLDGLLEYTAPRTMTRRRR